MTFVCRQQWTCDCDRCSQLIDTNSSDYYEACMSNVLQYSKNSIMHSTLSSDPSQQENMPPKPRVCPTYLFLVQQGIVNAGGAVTNQMESKLLMLEAHLGAVNHSLISSSCVPFTNPVYLKLYLFNVQEEYIETCLEYDKCARELIEEVSAKNSLGTALDWGLFLFWEGQSVHIGNDEHIMEVATKWGVELEYTQEREIPDNLILKKIDSFKQWGAKLFSDPKGRIFLKKYLYLEPALELSLCARHKERYQFLINEVYGRMRFEGFSLSYFETISLCAFFLLINQFDGTGGIESMSLNYLQPLLNEKFDSLTNTMEFKAFFS